MNPCCIEWFQYNLEIWSKKGTWHTLVAFSELWMMLPQKAKCVTHAHPRWHWRSPIPAAAGQGSATFLSNPALCVSWQESKTAISTCTNILCVAHRTKGAWTKPIADSWLASKAAVAYHSTKVFNKISATFACVWEQSMPVHFLNYGWWLQAASKAETARSSQKSP